MSLCWSLCSTSVLKWYHLAKKLAVLRTPKDVGQHWKVLPINPLRKTQPTKPRLNRLHKGFDFFPSRCLASFFRWQQAAQAEKWAPACAWRRVYCVGSAATAAWDDGGLSRKSFEPSKSKGIYLAWHLCYQLLEAPGCGEIKWARRRLRLLPVFEKAQQSLLDELRKLGPNVLKQTDICEIESHFSSKAASLHQKYQDSRKANQTKNYVVQCGPGGVSARIDLSLEEKFYLGVTRTLIKSITSFGVCDPCGFWEVVSRKKSQRPKMPKEPFVFFAQIPATPVCALVG